MADLQLYGHAAYHPLPLDRIGMSPPYLLKLNSLLSCTVGLPATTWIKVGSESNKSLSKTASRTWTIRDLVKVMVSKFMISGHRFIYSLSNRNSAEKRLSVLYQKAVFLKLKVKSRIVIK